MNATERAALLQSSLLLEDAPGRSLGLPLSRAARHPRRRGWLVRRMLAAADVFGLGFAFFLALVFSGVPAGSKVAPELEILIFLLTLPLWIVIAKLYGLYDHDEERTDHSTVDDFVSVFHLVTVGAWLLFMTMWLTNVADPNVPRIAFFWAFAVLAISLARGSARAYCRRQVSYLQNTVIVGAGTVGQLVAHKFLQHPEYGVNLVGFVDTEPMEMRDGLGHVAQLGDPAQLPWIVELLDVERVVIAFSSDSHDEMLELIRSLKRLDVQIDIVPRLFEVVGPKVGIHTVEGLPLVGLPPLTLARSSAFLKRATDIVLSALGLLVLSPLLLAIALRIKTTSPGPVLFRQVRVGAEGHPFEIFKFRTMDIDAEARKADLAQLSVHAKGDPRMFKVPDDPRVTPFGRTLRRYSLDELPQLFNVLRGEMSLVGPRPLILAEDEHVREWARERLSLKPGITGPWQVMGGSDIPFEEMVKLDYLYVTAWSVFSDLKLVIRTLPALLREKAAY